MPAPSTPPPAPTNSRLSRYNRVQTDDGSILIATFDKSGVWPSVFLQVHKTGRFAEPLNLSLTPALARATAHILLDAADTAEAITLAHATAGPAPAESVVNNKNAAEAIAAARATPGPAERLNDDADLLHSIADTLNELMAEDLDAVRTALRECQIDKIDDPSNAAVDVIDAADWDTEFQDACRDFRRENGSSRDILRAAMHALERAQTPAGESSHG